MKASVPVSAGAAAGGGTEMPRGGPAGARGGGGSGDEAAPGRADGDAAVRIESDLGIGGEPDGDRGEGAVESGPGLGEAATEAVVQHGEQQDQRGGIGGRGGGRGGRAGEARGARSKPHEWEMRGPPPRSGGMPPPTKATKPSAGSQLI